MPTTAAELSQPVLVATPDGLAGETRDALRTSGAAAVIVADGPWPVGLLTRADLTRADADATLAELGEAMQQVAVVSPMLPIATLLAARRRDGSIRWAAVRGGDSFTGVLDPDVWVSRAMDERDEAWTLPSTRDSRAETTRDGEGGRGNATFREMFDIGPGMAGDVEIDDPDANSVYRCKNGHENTPEEAEARGRVFGRVPCDRCDELMMPYPLPA
ncbi:MAG TPA: hypothetical protein VJT67_12705 [Longimicrobiaceae bacterium]|nr:hypothetical protein [Longimicrobiaceae bacterium]